MKLEKFEQEYSGEIEKLKTLRFETVEVPTFKIPSYKFVYAKAVSIAFALPALAMVFAFFFYTNEVSNVNGDLAQIEASNNRILNQINTLDYEDNI